MYKTIQIKMLTMIVLIAFLLQGGLIYFIFYSFDKFDFTMIGIAVNCYRSVSMAGCNSRICVNQREIRCFGRKPFVLYAKKRRSLISSPPLSDDRKIINNDTENPVTKASVAIPDTLIIRRGKRVPIPIRMLMYQHFQQRVSTATTYYKRDYFIYIDA